jgi:hypothetical protein
MPVDRLALSSQRMAAVTLCFIIAMLLLNAAYWFYPDATHDGLAIRLTNETVSGLHVDVAAFPLWQKLGGAALSSLPLLALAAGLWQLRALFQCYGRREYFSPAVADHLGKTGRFVALWVILKLASEPMLSFWATMHEPAGQQAITVTFGSPQIVALFLAACIAIVARILRRASELDVEHRQFV